MAKRPRRFKKVSVSFPIDLYLKVAAIVEASPPHSMSSWIVEACKDALNDDVKIRNLPVLQPQFHREALTMEAPRLTDEQVTAVHGMLVGEGIAEMLNRGDDPTGNGEPLPAAHKVTVVIPPPLVDLNAAAQELARREFGPQVLSAAARSVAGWGKWDWAKRLEHLRELKAAAVSG